VHDVIAIAVIIFNSFMIANEFSQTLRPLRGQPIFTVLESQPRLAYRVALAMVSMLSFLLIYSLIIYPYVPMKYGGGNHPKVELFLSEPLNIPWSMDGMSLVDNGLRIGPVRLLLETEDTIIVTRSAERDALGFLISTPAYALSKKNIAACRFIPRDVEEKRRSKHESMASRSEPREGASTPILPPR